MKERKNVYWQEHAAKTQNTEKKYQIKNFNLNMNFDIDRFK